MAKFLKIDADGKTVMINVEHVRYMNALQHQPNHTNIHFAFDHVIIIEALAARAEMEEAQPIITGRDDSSRAP